MKFSRYTCRNLPDTLRMARLIDATLSPRLAQQTKRDGRWVNAIKKTQVRAWAGALPGIANAQQVKLKAALQVPVTELFFGQSLARIFPCAIGKSVRQRKEGAPGAGPPRHGA
jgi:hypothetical protein